MLSSHRRLMATSKAPGQFWACPPGGTKSAITRGPPGSETTPLSGPSGFVLPRKRNHCPRACGGGVGWDGPEARTARCTLQVKSARRPSGGCAGARLSLGLGLHVLPGVPAPSPGVARPGARAQRDTLSPELTGTSSPMIQKAHPALLPPQDVGDTVETLMVRSCRREGRAWRPRARGESSGPHSSSGWATRRVIPASYRCSSE